MSRRNREEGCCDSQTCFNLKVGTAAAAAVTGFAGSIASAVNQNEPTAKCCFAVFAAALVYVPVAIYNRFWYLDGQIREQLGITQEMLDKAIAERREAEDGSGLTANSAVSNLRRRTSSRTDSGRS